MPKPKSEKNMKSTTCPSPRKSNGVVAGKPGLQRFDPFRDRLSRDIRNSLSNAFVLALEQMAWREVERVAEDWLKKGLHAVYKDYIRDRIERYRCVFQKVHRSTVKDPLALSLYVWNESLYFEMHEYLECLWREASGEDREALKGLIKAAGTYVHLEMGRQQAAHRLAAKASQLLRAYRRNLSTIANLEVLIEKLKSVDGRSPQLKIAWDEKLLKG
jgi:hypothetical protein